MEYVNVHAGAGVPGSAISRGSLGCITIAPMTLQISFANSDWSGSTGKTGNSSGTSSVYRGQEDVDSFLCILDNECSSNIEFSEVSNELLFQVVTRYPRFSLKSLSESSGVEREFVLNQLTNPLSDLIDLRKALQSVESVQGYDASKKAVLAALKKAVSLNK